MKDHFNYLEAGRNCFKKGLINEYIDLLEHSMMVTSEMIVLNEKIKNQYIRMKNGGCVFVANETIELYCSDYLKNQLKAMNAALNAIKTGLKALSK